jgi:hypothetical protein
MSQLTDTMEGEWRAAVAYVKYVKERVRTIMGTLSTPVQRVQYVPKALEALVPAYVELRGYEGKTPEWVTRGSITSALTQPSRLRGWPSVPSLLGGQIGLDMAGEAVSACVESGTIVGRNFPGKGLLYATPRLKGSIDHFSPDNPRRLASRAGVLRVLARHGIQVGPGAPYAGVMIEPESMDDFLTLLSRLD